MSNTKKTIKKTTTNKKSTLPISFEQVIKIGEYVYNGNVDELEKMLDRLDKDTCKRLVNTKCPMLKGKDGNPTPIKLSDNNTAAYKLYHTLWIKKGYVDS